MVRVARDRDNLQIDFMHALDGIRSFEALRSRAGIMKLGKYELRVADLADVIKSKRAAGRPQDLAIIELLEETLREKEKTQPGRGAKKGK